MSKQKQQLPSPPSALVELAEVAPTQHRPLGLLAHYSDLPSVEGAGIMTTLDLSSPGAVVQLQNVLAGGGVSLWDLPPDQVVGVEHVVAHYASRVDDETGEVSEGPMLTLIGPDGIFHTGSQYAFRALQLCAMLRGAPPWQPPVCIRAVRVRSRNKRDFQSILLAE